MFRCDLQAVLEHVTSRTDIDRSQVFVFGASIGGAVAIDLAAKNPDKVSVGRRVGACVVVFVRKEAERERKRENE